ncbi:ATP synthase F1 subunit gamma [Candidatus Legionella polyplacis]|uniref:ATP synthase F1 subunit gamma n=1 Tax=Candidatus Legionella polyplacis TaxID=2005262 RepID=UPI000C1EB6EE|nr:ATP synthase F1 subunit gamma [Candidatus Legionella polyplacis]ATW01889.1 ATP synthase F1 subunit gamma [Candidatus Legionella polyplacis]
MDRIKSIKDQISSIKRIQKITKAMEMVSISKMKKTKERMVNFKQYFDSINSIIVNILNICLDYKSIFLKKIKYLENNIGLIILTTSKGLCGGLNNSLLRNAIDRIKLWINSNKDVSIFIVGKKGCNFFNQLNYKVIAVFDYLEESLRIEDIFSFIDIVVDIFRSKEIDSVYMLYNTYINNVSSKICLKRVLPLLNSNKNKRQYNSKLWTYLYEPNSKIVLDTLLENYIYCQIYQGLIENIACEQVFRRFSMKSATDNTLNILKDIQLKFNKIRQSSITQELAEIMCGVN